MKVEGVILADGTWLAQEIKLQDDRNDAGTIVKFAGVVESVDPLVVNGITLLVTDDSRIDPEILVGDMAQVAARLTADGRWVLVWIRPLLPPTTGCFTIHALVTAVTNSQITLANWPALTLDDNVAIDGTLLPNSIISLHLCQGHDQTIQVVNIIVIQLIININPPVTHDNNQPGGSGRVTICHVPPGNPDNRHTITVGISAWENEHSRHGDTLGPCGSGGHDDDDDDDDDD